MTDTKGPTASRDCNKKLINFDIILKAIYLPSLIIPVVVAVLIALLYAKAITPPKKDFLEFTAQYIVLPIGTIVALIRLIITRNPFWGWMLGLAAVFLCREWHFAGTSAGVYVGLVILIALAGWKQDKWQADFSGRTSMTFIALAFTFYFLSQSLDQGWWGFLIGKPTWKMPLEETLEIFGHASITLATICHRRK